MKDPYEARRRHRYREPPSPNLVAGTKILSSDRLWRERPGLDSLFALLGFAFGNNARDIRFAFLGHQSQRVGDFLVGAISRQSTATLHPGSHVSKDIIVHMDRAPHHRRSVRGRSKLNQAIDRQFPIMMFRMAWGVVGATGRAKKTKASDANSLALYRGDVLEIPL